MNRSLGPEGPAPAGTAAPQKTTPPHTGVARPPVAAKAPRLRNLTNSLFAAFKSRAKQQQPESFT